MATVKDVLVMKSGRLISVSPRSTVYEAAALMNERRIGSVLVCHGKRLVGIFTERDVLQRVVAQRRDADQTLVEEVMTSEVACCRSHTTVDEARGVMKNRRIRHLPVIDEGDELVGLISIGDLNAFQATDQERTIHWLEMYIHGQA